MSSGQWNDVDIMWQLLGISLRLGMQTLHSLSQQSDSHLLFFLSIDPLIFNHALHLVCAPQTFFNEVFLSGTAILNLHLLFIASFRQGKYFQIFL